MALISVGVIRSHRTMNICVRCSNVRSCSANIRTGEHEFKKKIKEHSNIEHANIRILANIRTFEKSNISEHSNIEHFNIQKKSRQHERSVAPARKNS